MSWLMDTRANDAGIQIIRHRDWDKQDRLLEQRAGWLVAQVRDRRDKPGESGRYEYRQSLDIADRPQGFIWPRASRPIAGASEAWPVVVKSKALAPDGSFAEFTPPPSAGGGAMDPEIMPGPGLATCVPANDSWEADTRYAEIGALEGPVSPDALKAPVKENPGGTRGIVLASTNEARQHALLFTGEDRLIAVHAAGNPQSGSQLWDLRDPNDLDPLRVARLQSMMRVIKDPHDGFGIFKDRVTPPGDPPKPRNEIAWNIGLGGRKDVHGGLVSAFASVDADLGTPTGTG